MSIDESDKSILEEIGTSPGITHPELRQNLGADESDMLIGPRLTGLEQNQLIEGRYRRDGLVGWYLTAKGESLGDLEDA